jgi:hypothetical protein
MLAMNKLFEITFDMFKNSIDNTISNKIFIRNGIKDDIPYLNKEEQSSIINYMYFNQKSHSLIKPINIIEWLPKKIYQTAYYIVYLYDTYWLVSHNSHEGIIVKSYITYAQYIENQFNSIRDTHYQYLEQSYWCSSNELFKGVQILEQSPDKKVILIKHMTFPNSKIIIDHYLVKNGKQIYYFPFSNNYYYKPILYKQ